jgi:hypothetical protein
MEIQVLARLKPTKYPERAKDVHSNNGIAWSGWVIIKFQLIGAALLLLSITALSQNANLVPNPSFEEYIDCPDNPGRIWKAEPWVAVKGSVDYFHECGTNNQGVPQNWGGLQEARSGHGYIGIAVCASPLAVTNPFMANVREFAGVPLTEPLMVGVEYRVEFFINLSDFTCYAIRNIGAYLSQGQPLDQIDHLLSRQPQLKYNEEAFLDNKTDWVRLSGNFTAQGGENFLTIGNFDDDDNTDTLAIPCNNSGQNSAYYFIDDVSVIPVDSLVGIGETQPSTMSIYPNPAPEYFVVETEQGHGGTVQLLDIAGRQVAVTIQPQIAGKWHVDIANIPAGIYLLEVQNIEGRKAVQKVLVQH